MNTLRYIFAEMPQHLPALTDEHSLVWRCVDAVVAGQLAGECHARTNGELAKRFGCCPRTIQNWRAEGAPLDGGGGKAAMFRWLGARRYAPKETEARYHSQLDRARLRGMCRHANRLLKQLCQLRKEQRCAGA